MGEPEPGSGQLTARWGQPPPRVKGFIDTRPPPDGRPFREIRNLVLADGHKFPVWFAYAANGPKVTLLYAIKHPSQKPQVKEMDQRAAKLLVSRFRILKPSPTVVMSMPSESWQAEHFAQEVAKAASLPLRTGMFTKKGAIKGVFPARKQQWARRNLRLVDRENVEGQSVILADDNVGTGFSMSACAEQLYARGAAYVLGVATFRITGAKDPDVEDVSLGFAKGLREPDLLEPMDPDEAEDDEDTDMPIAKNPSDRAAGLKRALVKNRDSLDAFTVKELAELYDANMVEMRFALSQLGLDRLVKPG